MYEVVLADSAKKQLQKLERSIQERIVATLERIRERPETFVRRLVGESTYRLRVGNYRVIIDLQREELVILVIEVSKREDAY